MTIIGDLNEQVGKKDKEPGKTIEKVDIIIKINNRFLHNQQSKYSKHIIQLLKYT